MACYKHANFVSLLLHTLAMLLHSFFLALAHFPSLSSLALFSSLSSLTLFPPAPLHPTPSRPQDSLTMKITLKSDDKLHSILESFDPIKHSFKTFIVQCLKSKDKRIVRRMKNFYAIEGPAELMNIWNVQVHKGNDVRSMLEAATDLIVKHCTVELTDASEDPKLRLSAKSVTSSAANSFKLKTVRRSFERNAPTLTRLLTGFATVNDTPT